MDAKCLLYIGAGDDVEVVKTFPNVSNFVLVDSLPRTQYGCLESNKYFSKSMYKRHFIFKVSTKLRQLGFDFHSAIELDKSYFNTLLTFWQKIRYTCLFFPNVNPIVYEYVNYETSQTLKYYFSTNFPSNVGKYLIEDIKKCDSVFVNGFHPDLDLLKYLKKPIYFFGSSSTCFESVYFGDTEDNKMPTIISFFIDHPSLLNTFFSKIYLVDNTILHEVNHLSDLDKLRDSLNYNSDSE